GYGAQPAPAPGYGAQPVPGATPAPSGTYGSQPAPGSYNTQPAPDSYSGQQPAQGRYVSLAAQSYPLLVRPPASVMRVCPAADPATLRRDRAARPCAAPGTRRSRAFPETPDGSPGSTTHRAPARSRARWLSPGPSHPRHYRVIDKKPRTPVPPLPAVR